MQDATSGLETTLEKGEEGRARAEESVSKGRMNIKGFLSVIIIATETTTTDNSGLHERSAKSHNRSVGCTVVAGNGGRSKRS